MAKVALFCPNCRNRLVRHCPSKSCPWWVCTKDKLTWVLKIVKAEGQEPVMVWNLCRYFAAPLKQLPPLQP